MHFPSPRRLAHRDRQVLGAKGTRGSGEETPQQLGPWPDAGAACPARDSWLATGGANGHAEALVPVDSKLAGVPGAHRAL